MKKCPFCAEEIQDEAIKCKHCGEFLDGFRPARGTGEKPPWYFGMTAIVLSIMAVGPLALPLVWVHPRLNWLWKTAITGVVLVLSWLAYQMVMEFLNYFNDTVTKALEFR